MTTQRESAFSERLNGALIRDTNGGHFDEGDQAMYVAGAKAALLLLAEEHERYLAKNEKRSDIGPLFDSGLNTAAQAIAKSCRERASQIGTVERG